jgi:hypothetical protein
MGINSKVAKIPFFILYLILAVFISYNWIRVILFQRNFEVFGTEQPWDYYLSSFFVNALGISHQQYFLFAFPVILLILYAIPKVFGQLLTANKKSNVKGDNHLALIIILLIAPVTFGVHKLLGPGWRNHLAPGIILISLFSLLSWLDERNFQKQLK